MRHRPKCKMKRKKYCKISVRKQDKNLVNMG